MLFVFDTKKDLDNDPGLNVFVVRLEGFEPPTYCLEGSCSIQLSYKRALCVVEKDCLGVKKNF